MWLHLSSYGNSVDEAPRHIQRLLGPVHYHVVASIEHNSEL